MLLIGKYEPDTGLIERDWYSQGWIFKDEDAFLNRPDDVCYIPELSDTTYTRKDFLELCKDNEEIAKDIFYGMDWQHVESELDDLECNGEIAICDHCGKMFVPYILGNHFEMKLVTECPYCHKEYIE